MREANEKTKSKHLARAKRSGSVQTHERHSEQDDRAGAEPQLAGDPRAHAAGSILHDGHQRGAGLDIDGDDHIRPVTWDEWIALPVRPRDNAVQTMRGAIRLPTVIVAVNFAKVPKKRPKLCAKTIRERDGNRCQYTGTLLRPDEGSLDHVLPRAPKELPVTALIRNPQGIADWKLFVKE